MVSGNRIKLFFNSLAIGSNMESKLSSFVDAGFLFFFSIKIFGRFRLATTTNGFLRCSVHISSSLICRGAVAVSIRKGAFGNIEPS